MCFIAVIALAFLFVPADSVYAQACTISAECPVATPVCAGLDAACAVGSTCPSGDLCSASGTCTRGVCQPFMPDPGGSPSTYTFVSPTGTKTFSDIVCKAIDFFSNTILPPIAVLMMLVVGFLFMMGGQMPQKAIDARKTLLYVVAGVVLLLLAPGIIALVV
ncbi:MAG: TrbC/VirB2 family protein, partial [Patescibacteria group bacterium]